MCDRSEENEGEAYGKEPELTSRLRAMNRPLLDWYEAHARVLSWRDNPEPYRVWISEIMLQQTRVEAVKPYFERFIQAFPGVRALAEADDDRLMKLWEGLGYYNRARNLKKAACVIMESYGGRMPDEYDELAALPGIGSYTAGAIASIAYGKPVPAVDGNVLRVISRVLKSRADIGRAATKKWVEEMLRETMPRHDASHFNQCLFEIGATVCVPNGRPHCAECPLHSICLAGKEGLTDEIPVKTPPKKRKIEERTVCILEHGNRVGLNRRADTGLLASLYELPNVEGHLTAGEAAEAFGCGAASVEKVEPLPAAKHIFSHVEWHMIGYRVILRDGIPDGYIAAEKEELKSDYALPNAFGRYTKLIK